METLLIDQDCREGFQQALLAAITASHEATRENLLGQVFAFLDGCISELVDSGRLSLEPAPTGESHLDRFMIAPRH